MNIGRDCARGGVNRYVPGIVQMRLILISVNNEENF